MNAAPRLFRSAPELAAAPAEIQTPPFQGETAARRHFLRPRIVEKAVLAADFLIIVATVLGSGLGYLWLAGDGPANVPAIVGVGIIFAVNFTAITAARQNYRLKNLLRIIRQTREAIIVWTVVYGMLVLAGFAMKISGEISRGASIVFFAAGLAGIIALRLFAAHFISRSLANGSFAEKKIIVIAEKDRALSSRPLIELKRHGYVPIKTCQLSKEEISSSGASTSLRKKLADLIDIARSERIEDVYILVGWNNHRFIDGIVDALAVLPISVHLIPDETAARFLNNPVADIGCTWTAELKRAPLTRTELAAKRCFDFSLAVLGVIVLAPLMLVTALLIKLDSRGPVLFRQKRNGFNGQTFNIFKFRTMHVLEDGPTIRQTTKNDPRVTAPGRWLRKSSIDELPQLFNVIRGEMSLVGPRPHAKSHDFEYGKSIGNYAFRHHVKPGITGWAQVNGLRGETQKIELMERRVDYDLWYINNWSPLLDVKILFLTTLTILKHKSAY